MCHIFFCCGFLCLGAQRWRTHCEGRSGMVRSWNHSRLLTPAARSRLPKHIWQQHTHSLSPLSLHLPIFISLFILTSFLFFPPISVSHRGHSVVFYSYIASAQCAYSKQTVFQWDFFNSHKPYYIIITMTEFRFKLLTKSKEFLWQLL
jgi:hypothetical protein